MLLEKIIYKDLDDSIMSIEGQEWQGTPKHKVFTSYIGNGSHYDMFDVIILPEVKEYEIVANPQYPVALLLLPATQKYKFDKSLDGLIDIIDTTDVSKLDDWSAAKLDEKFQTNFTAKKVLARNS